MLFNSLSFLIFFPICIGIYFLIPKKMRAYWLLAASLFFYMCWNVSYGLLLISVICITYVGGLLIERTNLVKRKKIVLALTVTLSFLLLFVFKYLDFFLSNVNGILSIFGKKSGFSPLNILLPVGISFYIFQAAGYVIDVYRGEAAERNVVKYSLFVSFFPQLVAGPIERSKNLLGQIRRLDNERLFSFDDFLRGAFTMLYGFFLKMMIADRASIIVNTIFDAEKYSTYSGFEVLLGAILFSIQIYCDFAGYSYIAIGAARVMGFKLCDNFNTPYLSQGIKDFWDRWHMSLSTWFRDYLYFPLGGSKKGYLRKYINIFVVFLVSGLWHGAAWHFVFWGVLHGMLRIADELTQRGREKIANTLKYDINTWAHKGLRVMVNFFLVTLCWIFFRAESINQGLMLIKNMFSGLRLWQLTDDSLLLLGLDAKEMNALILFILILTIVDLLKRRGKNVLDIIMKQNDWFKFALFFFGIISIVLFGVYGKEYDATSFIYFQF